jgi:hypothetical protein
MKLISFDIGIKNMAYCIFSTDQNTLIVQDWGILNLLEKEEIAQKCSCELKSSKNPCSRKAKYVKNEMFFCETHAKKVIKDNSWIVRNKTNTPGQINKKNREDLILFGSKFKLLDMDNIPKTKKDCLEIILEELDKRSLFQIISKKKTTANETDLITIGRNMRQCLNQLQNVDDITHVIMENQISTIASRMKTVQGMLAQYYIMLPNYTNIEFVSSSNKLKHLVTTDDLSKNNNTYKQHKIDSIDFCKRFLEINPILGDWSEILNTNKKDDLSDAFLQGIWYLKHAKIITYAENLNINSITLS